MKSKKNIWENEQVSHEVAIKDEGFSEKNKELSMTDSRLKRRSLKQNKKQLYYTLGIILAVLIIAFNFGPFLIGGLGSVIDTISGKGNQATKTTDNVELLPPRIDPLVVATPSAKIRITGTSDYTKGNIELYVNNEKYDTTDLLDNQTYKFDRVALSEGTNYIKVRIVMDNKKSDFSEEEQIAYTKNAPKLEISFPADNQSFTKADQQITIKGSTDQDSSVSINGFIAIVDSQGNFSYDLRLNNGENKISVMSTGRSGQSTTKDITVSYSE